MRYSVEIYYEDCTLLVYTTPCEKAERVEVCCLLADGLAQNKACCTQMVPTCVQQARIILAVSKLTNGLLK